MDYDIFDKRVESKPILQLKRDKKVIEKKLGKKKAPVSQAKQQENLKKKLPLYYEYDIRIIP